ncbi:MAG: UDP-N-acetylglucosamine--N-acetylmuramyl-(pentapeptide) pyrophosphoryl-undecaprenol N-acetylglucosamine transferase [Clostridia bacterium]|nr:UDP-N-acetylglucosamine--N-acetylmuramyl-(pentapeptide) pyrophosphoryl-undecaprenol N-acetylglucosamine transferase [Clostridia bacterium]
MKKILFTGGGSAGHVIPNVALMEELISQGKTDVCYMGTAGIEKTIVTERKIPFYTISCPKLVRGKNLSAIKNNLRIPFAFKQAVKEAEKGLTLFRPDLVFSKGGYVALPVIFAAKKMGIPCIAHESDFSLGLANRLSAKKCKTVLTAFPETAKGLKNGKYGGAPIRRSVLSANREEERKKLGLSNKQKVLLVFGGGSGSKAINEALRSRLSSLTKKYYILHVCGKGNAVENTFKNYRQIEFATDMGSLYASSDLVISRAGAGTVFELLALKKPSLLIPLAGATRGDQKQNAEYFHAKGLCRVLPQERLERLEEEIDAAFLDKEMKERLLESNYAQGNSRILNEINAHLYE